MYRKYTIEMFTRTRLTVYCAKFERNHNKERKNVQITTHFHFCPIVSPFDRFPGLMTNARHVQLSTRDLLYNLLKRCKWEFITPHAECCKDFL